MNVLRVASLIAATMTTGLVAGVYFIYGNAFMPGLAKTDDKTFVGAFQAVDRAIINPVCSSASASSARSSSRCSPDSCT